MRTWSAADFAKLVGARPQSGNGWRAHCPAHDDDRESLSISEGKNGKLLVRCFAGCPFDRIMSAVKGRTLRVAEDRKAINKKPGAVAGLKKGAEEMSGVLSPLPIIAQPGARDKSLPVFTPEGSQTTYEIRDVRGDLVARHVRRELPDGSKTFLWRLPDGRNGLGGTKVADLPLYGSERLSEWPAGARVILCEGEKACDALRDADFAAVGTVTGAGTIPSDRVLESLRGFEVVLWADNDEPGRKHMERIRERLVALGVKVAALVTDREGGPGADAYDFIARHKDLGPGAVSDAVFDLIDEAKSPASSVQAPVLGEEALRDALDRIEAEATRYVWLPDHAPAVAALWAAHTYCFERFQYTPYLHITGPSKRCGKTRLLDFLRAVVLEPVLASAVTAAALSRMMDHKRRAALLLDECDTLLSGNPERAEEIRALLNMGFQRDGRCIKCAPGGAGLIELPAFGPKALAGIGNLWDTVADRTIRISMSRKPGNVRLERLCPASLRDEIAPLRETLEALLGPGGSLRDKLASFKPEFLEGLDDRAFDIWEPLLAIAELAGGDWPEKARKAAVALSGGRDADDDSLSIELLRDIRTVFTCARAEFLATEDLVADLHKLPEGRWQMEPDKRLGLTGYSLAKLLRTFGVQPRRGPNRGSKKVAAGLAGPRRRGYFLEDFRDAFSKYLPPLSPEEEAEAREAREAGNSLALDAPAGAGGGLGSRPSDLGPDVWL